MKQVIIVPAYLGMSPGKVASQCCHVALPLGDQSEDIQKRAILRVDSKAHLNAIRQLWSMAVTLNPDFKPSWYAFVDSEPTTEGTAGKVTAVSIVGEEEIVNDITGTLELY